MNHEIYALVNTDTFGAIKTFIPSSITSHCHPFGLNLSVSFLTSTRITLNPVRPLKVYRRRNMATHIGENLLEVWKTFG